MKETVETAGTTKANSVALLVRRLQREIKRRWWVVAIATLAFALLAQFGLRKKHEVIAIYEARMWVCGKIQLDQNSSYREEVQDYYGTQMELMQSETNQARAREAVRKQMPDVAEIPVLLSVALSPRGAVITLRASGSDPDYVRRFLNAVMDQYLEYKREIRTQAADITADSISKELGRIAAESERAQERLSAFRRTNSLTELLEQAAGVGSYLNELNRKLADLNMRKQFLTLLASNQIFDRRLFPAADAPHSTDEQPANGYGYHEGMREITRLKAQREKLGKNLRPKHPAMIQLDQDIHAQEELTEFARGQTREEMTNAQVALNLEITNTEAAIRDWEEQALSQSAAMAEYDHLKQDVERADRQHDYLLSIVRSVDVNKNLDQDAIAVLQRPLPIVAQQGIQLPRGLLGAIAGLFLGTGVLLLLMFANDQVSCAEELHGRLTVPVIGQIPEVDRRKDDFMPPLLESGDCRHCFAESLKSIRSALFYLTVAGRRPKSLLVTSAGPGEGKSTVAANLAVAFACSGYSVLLVDGDLRCGVLPRLLGAASEPGLTDVLQDGKDLTEAIARTRVPNLSFLAPGRRVNNPGELFLSAAADDLLAQVYKDYDYVVVDSAPVLAADDTTSLAPKIEGIVFVVRGSFTTTRSAQRALEMLHDRQGCVLGVVCNRGADDVPSYDKYAKTYNGKSHD